MTPLANALPAATPPQACDCLRRVLRPDEAVAWAALRRPQWSDSLRDTRPFWVMGGVFAVVSLLFMVAPHCMDPARVQGTAWSYTLFMVPFLIMGLGGLAVPLWDRDCARRTLYVVTTRRAAVVAPSLVRGWTVQDFLPRQLRAMTCTERPDGSGDLLFETYTVRHGGGADGVYTATVRHGFFAIDRVRAVEAIVEALLLSPPET